MSPTHEVRNGTGSTVLLIGVKYGANAETERFLDSIRSLHGQEALHVVVIENAVGSSWNGYSGEPAYKTVHAPANLGYFGGADYALSLFLEQNPLPDWIIVSNTDLTIRDSGFLKRLTGMSVMPDVGVVAPAIRSNMTGRNQNPFMHSRPSAWRMHMYKWLYRSWFVLNGYEAASAVFHKVRGVFRRGGTSRVNCERQVIYAPHGAFLIFSKEYFLRGGDLLFPKFLFGEEVYVAEKTKELGLKVVYDPSFQVFHEEHRTTKLFKSRQIAKYVASSAAYCADSYFPLRSRG